MEGTKRNHNKQQVEIADLIDKGVANAVERRQSTPYSETFLLELSDEHTAKITGGIGNKLDIPVHTCGMVSCERDILF